MLVDSNPATRICHSLVHQHFMPTMADLTILKILTSLCITVNPMYQLWNKYFLREKHNLPSVVHALIYDLLPNMSNISFYWSSTKLINPLGSALKFFQIWSILQFSSRELLSNLVIHFIEFLLDLIIEGLCIQLPELAGPSFILQKHCTIYHTCFIQDMVGGWLAND